MSAYPRSRNPFADDGDEEEDEPQDWAGERERSPLSEADRRQRQLQQEAMRSAQSATDSSNRSLRLIYESEKMGTDTAEELMRQGEALRRTERMVDNMEEDLKTSQKHINSIKSVWGGIVNYFKGKPEPREFLVCVRLQAALNESKEHEDKYQQIWNPCGSARNGYPWNQHLRATHQQLDSNLDEMSLGLSRLKNLGLGLQVELEDQDSSIDNLLGKVDRMDGKINATNQQIKSLK
uniref:Synaptosomal-associated protein 29 n=1 Tax=Scleropages formosus TaxID=113540 RepID=A0A8C9W7C4_SCLFO